MPNRFFDRAPLAILACAFATSMCTGSNKAGSPSPGTDGSAGTAGAGTAGAAASGSAGGPGSPCTTLYDCTPPPSGCADSNHLEYFVPTACVNAQCVYETKLQTCVCVNGGCNLNSTAAGAGPLDPCTAADDCTPPPSQCKDGSTLVYYEPACELGSCAYGEKTLNCFCQDAGCVTNSTAGGAGPLECQFADSCSHLIGDFCRVMQPAVLQAHAATSTRG